MTKKTGNRTPSKGSAALPPHRVVRVLIADDHQMVREGLRMLLVDASVPALPGEQPTVLDVIGEATRGDEAVRMVAELQPDVVLMDLQMPGMDGLTATRAIRQAETAGRRVGILVLTSFDDEVHMRDAVQAGATGYLLKDVMREELVRAILAASRGVPTLDARVQQLLMRDATAPATVSSPLDVLTPRERSVLQQIARGAANKEIAANLNLSIGTVKGYVSAIFEKLDLDDRTQAALLAVKHGLE